MGAQRERRLIHRGKKFDFESVRFVGRDGREIVREMVRHPGAVVVVPIFADGRVGLIRNRRFTVGRSLWELPAGTLEAGEPPAECARRELQEETGYDAGSIEPLGRFYTTPGMTDELMHAFAATSLTHVGRRLEEDEDIEVEPTPASEALALVDSGELMDAKSMLGLLLARRRGLLEGEPASPSAAGTE